MAKQVIFGAENREKLLRGVNALSNAVKVTSVSYTHLTLPTKA